MLSEEAARAVEEKILPQAGGLVPGELRARLRRAVIAADPDGAERRRQRAERHAKVSLYGDEDGTATLTGSKLPAIEAAAAMARITALARAMKAAGQAGGLDLHRARVMLGLLLGTLPYIPPAEGAPPDDPPPGDGHGPGSGGPGDGHGPGGGDPGGGAPGSGAPGGGAPGGGGPGSGDPGSGDPGSGAPGSGDPGSGDPGPPGTTCPAPAMRMPLTTTAGRTTTAQVTTPGVSVDSAGDRGSRGRRRGRPDRGRGRLAVAGARRDPARPERPDRRRPADGRPVPGLLDVTLPWTVLAGLAGRTRDAGPDRAGHRRPGPPAGSGRRG